jgi:hypothetical protein
MRHCDAKKCNTVGNCRKDKYVCAGAQSKLACDCAESDSKRSNDHEPYAAPDILLSMMFATVYEQERHAKRQEETDHLHRSETLTKDNHTRQKNECRPNHFVEGKKERGVDVCQRIRTRYASDNESESVKDG